MSLRHFALAASVLLAPGCAFGPGQPFTVLSPTLKLAQAPAEPQELTPEEKKAIEEAVAADAPPPPAPPPAPAAPRTGFSLNPDLTLIADFALAYFSSDTPLQTGGHDPTSTGFTLQALELAASAAVDPYFRFNANLAFSAEGVEIEEAYGTTTALPERLQLRIGQFLTRIGRHNAMHLHAWELQDQPLALGRIFGGEGSRGAGVEASWLTPLPWYVELLASATDPRGEETARSFLADSPDPLRLPLDLLYLLAARQFFAPHDDLSVLLGLSAMNGPAATGLDTRTDVFGVDLYVKYRPLAEGRFTVLSLQTEWFWRRRQVPADLLTDLSGYAQLFWRFEQRWGAALRWELGTPARGMDGGVAADPLDPEWTRSRQRLSAALTFWPTEFSRLRLQASSDLSGWSAFLAAEFGIGPHAAHQF